MLKTRFSPCFSRGNRYLKIHRGNIFSQSLEKPLSRRHRLIAGRLKPLLVALMARRLVVPRLPFDFAMAEAAHLFTVRCFKIGVGALVTLAHASYSDQSENR